MRSQGKRRLSLVIPPMQCVPNCAECCGVVPASPTEIKAIRAYAAERAIQPRDQGTRCPFHQDGQCAVYPVRPRVCQAFGHGPEYLRCPHVSGHDVRDQVALRKWVLELGPPAETLHDAFLAPGAGMRAIAAVLGERSGHA